MNILVMGGSEFVSASLAKDLIRKGHIVDIFTRGIKLIKYDGFRRHIKGDRKNIEDLRKGLSEEKYDYVFDISAYTKEDVERIVNALNKENLKRYIFCSSGSVYIPSDNLVDEAFARGENINWGDYGLGKKKAEDYLFEMFNSCGFPITIFRPTYIYGEENNLYREAYFFDRIVNGLPIPIPDSNARTQFVHISDLVKVFESAMYSEKSIGQAYNLTHPEEVTWDSLIETVIKVVEKKVDIKKVDKSLNIASREYFPFRDVMYLLDIEKSIKDELYIPQISLKEGLEKAYKWYCEIRPNLEDKRMDKVNYVLNIQEGI